MTKMMKVLSVMGLSSVYLMQVDCAFKDHGFSMISNGVIPNPFTGILSVLGLA